MKKEEGTYNSYRRGFLQGFFAPITFFTLLTQVAQAKKDEKLDLELLKDDKIINVIDFEKIKNFKKSSLQSIKYIEDNGVDFLANNLLLKYKLSQIYSAIFSENIPVFLNAINSSLTLQEIITHNNELEILHEIKKRLNDIKEASGEFVKIKNTKSINTQAQAWKDVLALQADSFQPYKKMVDDYEKAR